jgi:hypothetical protein
MFGFVSFYFFFQLTFASEDRAVDSFFEGSADAKIYPITKKITIYIQYYYKFDD